GLWHQGSHYIVSAPYLWRLEDRDGDGVADVRERIIGEMEFDGRANQHGPYRGPNGRLYLSGGHFGYDFLGKDGSRSGVSRAAGVFSCLPDGSDVLVEGQGGINPVDIVFTDEGDMLSTCAIFDSFGGRHDALIHWVPGGLTQTVYGKPLLAETGIRLPATSRWGQVAPAGLLRYRSAAFGPGHTDDLFACHFNTHEVVRIRLERSGSTFVSEDEVFLSSSNTDFHPADILEDADGSLLLIDTGGWLSWGCPHSKIARPQIRGAIYRIRKTGAERPEDPRGLKIDWSHLSGEALVALLRDTRPAVRDRAAETLITRGDDEALVDLLATGASAAHRRQGVWVLSRIPGVRAQRAIRNALGDEDAGVRQAAARSAGRLKDRGAVGGLVERIRTDIAPVRRAAASALGAIGSPEAVPALFEGLLSENDIYLNHAHLYALIQIGAGSLVREYWGSDADPRWQKAVLRVLDAMESDLLSESMVLDGLQAPNEEVREEARRILAARPQWSEAILPVYRDLRKQTAGHRSWAMIEGMVDAFQSDSAFQKEMLVTLKQEGADEFRIRLLAALGFLKELPEALHPGIESCLVSASAPVRKQTLDTLIRFDPLPFASVLESLAREPGEPVAIRLGAVEALIQCRQPVSEREMDFLVSQVGDGIEAEHRQQAARAMARLPLKSKADFQRWCRSVDASGPLEIEPLIEVCDQLD
ncbi:MAG: HEAT repeat domain-containing protein, partial [Verrucomicrobiota bacterium]